MVDSVISTPGLSMVSAASLLSRHMGKGEISLSRVRLPKGHYWCRKPSSLPGRASLFFFFYFFISLALLSLFFLDAL